MSDNLARLQNGSDIRGVALAVKDGSPVTLTTAAAGRLACAFGIWLSEKTGKGSGELKVGVGHDSRVTAEALKVGIIGGLASLGARVYDCGLASTPSMFMGTVFPQTGFDGSIMITASHLPSNRNGMKFFTKDGGLDKQDIAAIIKLAEEQSEEFPPGAAESCGLIELYSAFLREKIISGAGLGDTPLSGLRIVVDAGNGAGGFFVRDVLVPLGADCAGSQFLEPDGLFPNHEPNPENQEAMESIRRAVLSNKADLGIIFDTDVDRMSAVLPDGSEVNRDSIIALISAILAPEFPGATVVTDSVTSDRLTLFLERELGLKHHCFKRGYKNVINEAVRLNNEGVLTPLAIETSGHGAMKENYFLDDGAYMAVRLIIAAAGAKRAGTALSALIEGFTPAQFRREYRFPISGESFGEYGRQVLAAFEKRAKEKDLTLVKSYEGVRVSFPGEGWVLLRISLHDPLMPMNMESGTQRGLEHILSACRAMLSDFDRLDISCLG